MFTLLFSACLLFGFNLQAASHVTHEEKPLVSMIVSLYDADEFIFDFMVDIVRQSIFPRSEVIIINANSPGNEGPIIREYMKKYPNIIYVELDEDPGLYAVWNMAIKMARADFITNANLDDRRNPVWLEEHVKVLQEKPFVDLVYSDFLVTFQPNETFEQNSHQYVITPDDFSPNVMYKCITGPQPTWRKSMHDRYGYFDETFVSGGDFEFFNRAVSKGSKFYKLPGQCGLYYYNPKGLSTDAAKRDLVQNELYRINGMYGYMWITQYQYFCTACDSKYFRHLLHLIGTIHSHSFQNLGEIAVFDLGMTPDQRAYLGAIAKVSVHDIELTHPDLLTQRCVSVYGKTVPGWYAWKSVVLKQALDIFPYVLYIDSGTTVLRPLDDLFKYIQQAGYFLCTIGDEKFYNQISHPIKWGATEYVKKYFNLMSPERRWVLDQEPLLSGTLGVSRKALEYLVQPLYELSSNLPLFEDDGTSPNGFGTGRHDQTVLSTYAYLHGLAIHHQDHKQENPIYLPVEDQIKEFYVTWNHDYVNEKTHLYNSRYDMSRYDHYVSCIQYR
jgi:glycosyltransferase involved in cell wall biosynthesis